MLKLIVSPVASVARVAPVDSRKKLICPARAFQCRVAGLAIAGAATALLLCTASYAVTPLDDRELNNNFLQNNIPLPQLVLDRLQSAGPIAKQPGQQPVATVQNNRINNVFANLAQAAGISNFQVSLNKKGQEANYSANNALFGIGILNEIAVKALDSDLSSSRWSGKFSQVIDLSQIDSIHFDHATGGYEVNNIQGIIKIEVSTYQANQKFR